MLVAHCPFYISCSICDSIIMKVVVVAAWKPSLQRPWGTCWQARNHPQRNLIVHGVAERGETCDFDNQNLNVCERLGLISVTDGAQMHSAKAVSLLLKLEWILDKYWASRNVHFIHKCGLPSLKQKLKPQSENCPGSWSKTTRGMNHNYVLHLGL